MKWFNDSRFRMTYLGLVAVVVLGGGNAKADLVMDAVRAEDVPYFGKGESFSNDGLRLYVAADLPGGYGSRDICVVERQSLDAPWGEPVNLGPNINTADHEGWPTISPDDLELYFGRGPDNGTQRWMLSTRASKDDPWGPAVEYTGIFPADFSADGLTKYSNWSGWRSGYGGSDLWDMTRSTLDDDWGNPVNLGPNVNTAYDERHPSISSDGLALFLIRDTRNARLHMCVRATTEDPWGPAIDVGSPVNGSWWIGWIEVSPDGSTLYCNRLGGLGPTKVSIKPFVDFTEDGMVDIDDLSAMIEYWGTDHSYYDIAPAAWGDGVVDEADLEVLMSYYGQAVDYTANTVIDVKPPHNPHPVDGERADVEKALPLSWTPGDTVTVHDLYFGTDRAAVENANISDTSGVYRGELSGNSYMPPEGVQAGQTYYWRLDKVRSEDSAKKGEIWSFTVVDGLIVDNFESYTNDVNEVTFEGPTIWNTWIDGWFTGTSGAIVGYAIAPFAEVTIVHNGCQSMPFFYDNDGTINEDFEEYTLTGVPYYSETHRTWDKPQDWTIRGVEVLTLWFYGEPDNSAEPFYVGLEDGAGKRKDITHPDPAVLTVPYWQQWRIPLADFTGVDLTAIKVMYIGVGDAAGNQPGGSGLVRIDDIELHRSASAPEQIVLEAEAGTITAPMKTYSDPLASGGRYIGTDDGIGNETANPPATGIATYSFSVAGGTYKISIRVQTPSGSSDSFWLRIPGATTPPETELHSSGWVRWNDTPDLGGWFWSDVFSDDDDVDATVLFTMDPGTHTLEIARREDGTLLDVIVISRID